MKTGSPVLLNLGDGPATPEPKPVLFVLFVRDSVVAAWRVAGLRFEALLARSPNEDNPLQRALCRMRDLNDE